MTPPPSASSGAVRSVPNTVARGLSGGLGALLVAGTVVGLVGSWWWPFDLVANFRPQYAAALFLLGALHLGLRSRGWAAVFLTAASLNGILVAPYLIGTQPPEAAGPVVSVLSFNVGLSNPQRAEVAEYVAEQGPDVVFVYESSFEWEDALARGGPTEMTWVAKVPDDQIAGITVLADRELLARPIPLTFGNPASAVAIEFDLGGQVVEVLGLHPPSPTSGSRADSRDRLLADAAEWVSSRSRPVLVVGDLNATPWSHAFRNLRWRGGLADTLPRFGLQVSWPSGWGPFMVPIDHALHTAGLVAVDRSTGPSLGSAHRPVLITVAGDAG